MPDPPSVLVQLHLPFPPVPTIVGSNVKTLEVSMKARPRTATPLLVAQFEAEARRLVADLSENQRRFLSVGLSHGKALEPVGRLAGQRA